MFVSFSRARLIGGGQTTHADCTHYFLGWFQGSCTSFGFDGDDDVDCDDSDDDEDDDDCDDDDDDDDDGDSCTCTTSTTTLPEFDNHIMEW